MNRVSLCMGLSNSVCHVTSVYVAMCARLRERQSVYVCVCVRDRFRLYVPKDILYIMYIIYMHTHV